MIKKKNNRFFRFRSKVLHLNKLATQIVQQMALINIPDPPTPPEPLPPPTIEIDLNAVHERLNGLDHVITNLTKMILEKEETVLYVINKRPGNGEITTTVHSPIRSGGGTVFFLIKIVDLFEFRYYT